MDRVGVDVSVVYVRYGGIGSTENSRDSERMLKLYIILHALFITSLIVTAFRSSGRTALDKARCVFGAY